MRRAIALLLALAFVPTSLTGDVAVAGARELEVRALDDHFLPSLADVARGGTIVWTFDMAERSHTATDSSGMDLFDSGIVSPGGPSFSFRFRAAGSYPYTCTIHMATMNGRVNVPVRASPASGRLGRTFRVRWAVGPPDDGFVYDLQIRPPGGSWSAWRSGVETSRSAFEPAEEGTYRFRARLRRLAGGRSDWSGAASIQVG
jgi:plastocyanin